jgi:hypothetical protein
MKPINACFLWATIALGVACARGQSDGAAGPIDECGQLVQGATCVLVEVSGGRYALTEFYGFRVGDPVRVVGEIDPECQTICADADGCIRGAVLYDPAELPCGTPLPNLAADFCTGVSSSIFAGLAATLFICGPGGLLSRRKTVFRAD